MTLLNQSVQVYGQLDKLFAALREGQAPENFNRPFLKDIGFKSSNHHAFIPLLKGLGFLTSEGTPTQRYKDFLDPTKWKVVLAEAVREAYSDIFVLKSKPTKDDKDLIVGKYRSTYNLSETAADRSARTFLALAELADKDTLYGDKKTPPPQAIAPKPTKSASEGQSSGATQPSPPPAETLPAKPLTPPPAAGQSLGLHYNIQIHLPATKDVEVYNAIFKSLREHLID